MKRRKAHITLVFCSLLFPLHLEATIYTYNTTIDLRESLSISHPTGQWNYSWALSGAPTFNIQPGDTVQGTIAFARNEALQFTGPVNFAFIRLSMRGFITPNPIGSQTTTTLNGVTGSLTVPTPTSASYTSPFGGQMHIGYAITATQTEVAFTGSSYSALIISGSGNYTPNLFFAHTLTDTADSVSVIPEPSVAGFIGMGLIVLLRNPQFTKLFRNSQRRVLRPGE